MRVSIQALNAEDAERVYELSQRTNQLNFRGAKYTREDVRAMQTPDPDVRRLTIRCADRFGDYGLIGFVVVDLAKSEVSDLFMSCRVQRKRVEQAVFSWIAGEAAARKHERLTVLYRSSERNGAARAMLEDLGFEREHAEDAGQVWRREVSRPFEDADVARIVADPLVRAA